VLLTCNKGGSDKTITPVIGKYRSHVPLGMSRDYLQTINKQANTNSWVTTKVLEYYLTQLVTKPGARNSKILLLSVCCSSKEHYIFQQHQSYDR
jgi:hypothetical protein